MIFLKMEPHNMSRVNFITNNVLNRPNPKVPDRGARMTSMLCLHTLVFIALGFEGKK